MGKPWYETLSHSGCHAELICTIGHCYLMSENLQKAYDAYQQALVNLRDAKVCS